MNAGTTWEPIFEKYGSSSIGDVAFFQKDPNIIWVGTGEECVRNSVAWGDGIYKSTDGGKTFTRMGLETTQTIGKVLPHPTDPDICLCRGGRAIPGDTPGDRGLFKTTDGGKTWQKLGGGLPNDGKTGAIDLVMDPANPDVLYVTFWQRLRQPWRFDSGGPNGGIFKTTDGGKTWTKLTKGLPAGDLGRIGIAISRSNPKVLKPSSSTASSRSAADRRGAAQARKDNPDYKDMTKLGTGHLPVRGRRRDLDVHEPDEQPAVLLQPHLHQPARRQARLFPDDEPAVFRGRRQDVQVDGRPPSRFPRHVARPDEQEPVLCRPGRRRVPHPRPRQDLDLLRQPLLRPSSTP